MNLQDSAQPVRVSFLDFMVDLAAERLVRGSVEIKLRPKSFHVLRCLIEHQGRVVTRDELMEVVWAGVAVTDESLSKCIADIRRALADDSQGIVRTVTRRGFLFQAEVRVVEPQPVPLEPSRTANRTVFGKRRMLALVAVALILVAGVIAFGWRDFRFARKPVFEAIAVLPFEFLSNTGADQQYLGDGMTEALITILGESSPFRVIARTSVNRYLRTKNPIREIARELAVDAVVEGTVSQSGDRVRVTANLIQVSPEQHIWAHFVREELPRRAQLAERDRGRDRWRGSGKADAAEAITSEDQPSCKPRGTTSLLEGAVYPAESEKPERRADEHQIL
jgi:DNA-binding winged helix-turn-helix (wHTH) protein/TolB-like protein